MLPNQYYGEGGAEFARKLIRVFFSYLRRSHGGNGGHRAQRGAEARLLYMSDKDERDDEHKESTQAIAQQPQEEFIEHDNMPSKTEAEVREEKSAKSEPPRH